MRKDKGFGKQRGGQIRQYFVNQALNLGFILIMGGHCEILNGE